MLFFDLLLLLRTSRFVLSNYKVFAFAFIFAIIVIIVTSIRCYAKKTQIYRFYIKQYYSKSTSLLKYKEIVITSNFILTSSSIVFKAQIIPEMGIIIVGKNKNKQMINYTNLKGIELVEYFSNGVQVHYKIICLTKQDGKIFETVIIDNRQIDIPMKIMIDLYNLLNWRPVYSNKENTKSCIL
ncbi:hypothetical protein QEN19_000723 [Hanseniaspora menglaensis]